jgi:SAM-dependent methyltransferase
VLLAIDLGCGAKKKPGTIGVDAAALPGVDHIVNFDQDPLPFADGSVGSIFSSHCLEHVHDPLRVLRELCRVAAPQATMEIWVPYGWNHDAFFFDHRNYFNERFFEHVGRLFPDFWKDQLGARLVVDEIVFALDDGAEKDLAEHGVDLAFALRYHVNVVREIGILGSIDKSPGPAAPYSFRRSYAPNRLPESRRPIPARRSLGDRARAALDVLAGRRG